MTTMFSTRAATPGATAVRRGVRLAIVAAASAGIAACGSTNLLGPSDTTAISANPAPAATAAQPAVPASQSRVAVAPIMGAPEAVAQAVSSELAGSLQRQRVEVVPAGGPAPYTVRGYIVATKERAATKVSYIFDLTDGSGKRVNRIQGEEQAQGAGNDPWAAVTPDLARRITDKTATSLAAALASLGPASSAVSQAPAAGGPVASVQPPAGAGGPTTGSIDRTASAPVAPAGGSAATVPDVTGAPGDGNSSLAAAMRQELQTVGVGAPGSGQRGYGVAGKVTVGAVKDGKQPVRIEWRVTDPSGTHLATVAQNNEIPAGTLDGSWGGIANDAAQGAAQKIKAIIDENRASGGARTKSAGTGTRG